jgi:hypothetical protein
MLLQAVEIRSCKKMPQLASTASRSLIRLTLVQMLAARTHLQRWHAAASCQPQRLRGSVVIVN